MNKNWQIIEKIGKNGPEKFCKIDETTAEEEMAKNRQNKQKKGKKNWSRNEEEIMSKNREEERRRFGKKW